MSERGARFPPEGSVATDDDLAPALDENQASERIITKATN
jgi:hypothetical protein